MQPYLGGLLVVAGACGGGDASPVGSDVTTTQPSSDIRSADAVAEALTTSFGDERSAMAAVLLAADRGYTLAQIVDAAGLGTIEQSGSITTAAGDAAEPAGTPTNALVDDVSTPAASGFARPAARQVRVSDVVEGFFRAGAGTGSTLAVLLLLLDAGYSVDQIATAVVLDGSIGITTDLSASPWTLLDDDGATIPPAAPPTGILVQVDDRPIAGPLPPTAPPALDRAFEQAAGVYAIDPSTAPATDAVFWFGDGTLRSADGEIVVVGDGNASGEFELVFDSQTLDETGSYEIPSTFTLGGTLTDGVLTGADDGLSLTGTVLITRRHVADARGELFSETDSIDATGIVDGDRVAITIGSELTGEWTFDFVR